MIEEEVKKIAEYLVRTMNPSGAYNGGTDLSDLPETNPSDVWNSKKQYLTMAREICQLLQPKPDSSGLLSDEEINILWMASKKNREHSFDYEHELLTNQRDLTASIKDAGIQEIFRIITEDFVEMIANLYMTEENRSRTYELWQGIKKRVLKARYIQKAGGNNEEV